MAEYRPLYIKILTNVLIHCRYQSNQEADVVFSTEIEDAVSALVKKSLSLHFGSELIL